jgi:hypothetical protein
VHDLALSGPVARRRYFDAMFDWAATHVPSGRTLPSEQPPAVV